MPWLYNRAGDRFRTEDPAEITRLKAQGYFENGTPPPTVADTLFHPVGKSAKAVKQYLAENPGDAERVIAEEKAGEARTTIVQFDGTQE